jgi:hypothetical protein
MLTTEIEIEWQLVGKSLIFLCGEEHSEIRNKARNMILEIMLKTNNTYMILEKLYYDGL